MSTAISLSLVEIGLKTKTFYHYAKFCRVPFLNCNYSTNKIFSSCPLGEPLVLLCQTKKFLVTLTDGDASTLFFGIDFTNNITTKYTSVSSMDDSPATSNLYVRTYNNDYIVRLYVHVHKINKKISICSRE